MRKIWIKNSKNRDIQVDFGGFPYKSNIHYTLPNGDQPIRKKVLKSSVERQIRSLLEKYGTEEDIANAIIEGDPEINLQQVGKFISNTSRILIDSDSEPVFSAKTTLIKFDPFGKLKEETQEKETIANINVKETPISWARRISIDKAYNQFVFRRSYQLVYESGADFEFLLSMAKELHQNKEMVLLGGGESGKDPLVFQQKGKPYRAFLEGRVKGDSFLLLVHLADHELKPLPTA